MKIKIHRIFYASLFFLISYLSFVPSATAVVSGQSRITGIYGCGSEVVNGYKTEQLTGSGIYNKFEGYGSESDCKTALEGAKTRTNIAAFKMYELNDAIAEGECIYHKPPGDYWSTPLPGNYFSEFIAPARCTGGAIDDLSTAPATSFSCKLINDYCTSSPNKKIDRWYIVDGSGFKAMYLGSLTSGWGSCSIAVYGM